MSADLDRARCEQTAMKPHRRSMTFQVQLTLARESGQGMNGVAEGVERRVGGGAEETMVWRENIHLVSGVHYICCHSPDAVIRVVLWSFS